jgi:uncharacterized FAD-dependent dehydrogenase
VCPGGVVIPSQSENGTVLVNGMSGYDRDGVNSNSAICVSVSKNDFGGGIFDGLDFIEKIEKTAYLKAGGNFAAPFTTAARLCGISVSGNLPDPTYPFKTAEIDFNEIFPDFITENLKEGLIAFEKKIPKFASSGILTGVETRTSSPVRIIRNKNLESENIKGLYPCGEGAGYAGGIVSSAVDGIRAAIAVISRFYPFN